MCRPVPCDICGKTTWAGCGQHVAQVKAMVPPDQWCNGKHTPEQIAAANSSQPGLFSRIFNRS